MKWDFWSGLPLFVQKNGPAEVPLTTVDVVVATTGQMTLPEGPMYVSAIHPFSILIQLGMPKDYVNVQ